MEEGYKEKQEGKGWGKRVVLSTNMEKTGS